MTSSEKQRPPPLPPRESSSEPPPYSPMAMQSQDPRSSSTQSLVPDPTLEESGRRRLLLVYIHGFMGNETSFRSFPAHVHNLVTITLAETHVVHTKIYPRYKSRDSLEIARDNFSRWLAPHEDQWTDIILLGHSMGGLLAGDIALVFRHRIIGVVNFDVPFLGMHPGIIKAGLGSIFSSPPPPPHDAIIEDAGQRPSRMSTIFNPKPADPNYNPAFPNDVRLPNRKGWENSVHWLTKHYKDGLKEATKGLVKSHLEFGGAMADYKELKDRYVKVRALEEDDESKRKAAHPRMPTVPRIRFVNYYTASTGRHKKPKSPKSPTPTSPKCSASLRLQHQGGDASVGEGYFLEHARSDSTVSPEPELTHINPDPIADTPRASIEAEQDHGMPSSPEIPSAPCEDGPTNLPEIPPIPQEPPFVDLMQFPDKASRKAAEKEHDQALKEYQKAVKMRNKTINERTKMQERWEKDKAKERKEREKGEKKRLEQVEKDKKQRENEEKKRQEQVEKERKEKETQEKEKHMSAEEKQRQREREQRQTEAEQREAEARQRQREADLRDGKIPAEDKPEPPSVIVELEEDVGAMELGDSEPTHDSRSPYANYEFSRSGIMNQPPPNERAESSYTLSTTDSRYSQLKADTNEGEVKPKKLRKFCMLPPKDADGNKDPTWIRVFMENMDEVTAHTSLFFVNETYERLVGDVGARIEEWVKEADSS
ncbi:Trichoplein multi-domain protein [Pyrenophora tritici-repentis]|uniref:TolA, Membrane protein involved in colicin uptake n=1 Tax=Pyrenophora tritici-repentis TaxID=45151 RepID=A0A834VW57_9PLEO|nr:hypothetical protein A1F99_003870 [Pyrenophora tritici-repentis]KAF7576187.1 TolA, Membrane protein involved in colicin uptake [Pyrenophora tritici-repentis]KAI1573861.1 MhpC hydrolase or acyltransferase alpha beta hydrolase superfamily [Pyrenophora tritici-repentis]PZD29580.1 Trichoplein multi-domain protein [Pyrenophora tritici-repentis]